MPGGVPIYRADYHISTPVVAARIDLLRRWRDAVVDVMAAAPVLNTENGTKGEVISNQESRRCHSMGKTPPASLVSHPAPTFTGMR